MPKVTIWIREEDYPKWQAIADKPAWLHEHLNNQKSFRAMNLNEQVAHVKSIIDDPTYTEPEQTA